MRRDGQEMNIFKGGKRREGRRSPSPPRTTMSKKHQSRITTLAECFRGLFDCQCRRRTCTQKILPAVVQIFIVIAVWTILKAQMMPDEASLIAEAQAEAEARYIRSAAQFERDHNCSMGDYMRGSVLHVDGMLSPAHVVSPDPNQKKPHFLSVDVLVRDVEEGTMVLYPVGTPVNFGSLNIFYPDDGILGEDVVSDGLLDGNGTQVEFEHPDDVAKAGATMEIESIEGHIIPGEQTDAASTGGVMGQIPPVGPGVPGPLGSVLFPGQAPQGYPGNPMAGYPIQPGYPGPQGMYLNQGLPRVGPQGAPLPLSLNDMGYAAGMNYPPPYHPGMAAPHPAYGAAQGVSPLQQQQVGGLPLQMPGATPGSNDDSFNQGLVLTRKPDGGYSLRFKPGAGEGGETPGQGQQGIGAGLSETGANVGGLNMAGQQQQGLIKNVNQTSQQTGQASRFLFGKSRLGQALSTIAGLARQTGQAGQTAGQVDLGQGGLAGQAGASGQPDLGQSGLAGQAGASGQPDLGQGGLAGQAGASGQPGQAEQNLQPGQTLQAGDSSQTQTGQSLPGQPTQPGLTAGESSAASANTTSSETSTLSPNLNTGLSQTTDNPISNPNIIAGNSDSSSENVMGASDDGSKPGELGTSSTDGTEKSGDMTVTTPAPGEESKTGEEKKDEGTGSQDESKPAEGESTTEKPSDAASSTDSSSSEASSSDSKSLFGEGYEERLKKFKIELFGKESDEKGDDGSLTGSYLINNPDICAKASDGLDILYLIASKPQSMDVRDRIREGYVNPTVFENVKMEHVFFLGKTNSPNFQKNIDSEKEKYNDIAMAEFMDAPDNSTYKAISAMRWAKQFCPQAKHFLYIDEAMFVDTDKIVKGLIPTADKVAGDKYLLCPHMPGIPIPRQGPNAVKKPLFPSTTHFRSYCKSYAILLSQKGLFSLLAAAEETPSFPAPDIYMFGVLPYIIGDLGVYDVGQKRAFHDFGQEVVSCYEEKKDRCPIVVSKANKSRFETLFNMVKTRMKDGHVGWEGDNTVWDMQNFKRIL